MLGSPAGPGGPTQRGGLWPLAPAPAPPTANFSTDGFGKYGIYSLLPGSPAFGSALYSHSSIGRFTTGSIQPSSGTAFHAAHKVSDSIYTSTGYTFGAPTPPPGSPYSPVPVTQLELLAKGFNSNIIIQQPDYSLSPKKVQQQQQHYQQQQPIYEKQQQQQRCDEKCCSNKPQKPCSCQSSPAKTKFLDSPSGCSRTNPVDWSSVCVKKEPGATPCQVAEITTSDSPVIKVEVSSPTQHQKSADVAQQVSSLPPVVTTTGNIPVGIAVARQRIQQHEVVSSPSLPSSGLLATVNTTQIKEVARISEIDAGMAATTTAGVTGGGTLLQCSDDRSGGFASWPVGGAHNSALATPTLWQYPAPMPMEPLMPMPLPMPPVGLQLVRDHNTGGLLLLPTTGVDQFQQTVVWPSYHQPSSHVLLPPLPPPPLQLLSSGSSDYLQSSTTLHQHTQTHSTRLVAVTTDNKRKLPLPIPTTTFIKIETDATLDQSKTLQAVSSIGNNTGTVYTDQSMAPLVTTHVIYQHPTNLIVSQTPAPDTVCREQATSPVACLTPPPEAIHTLEEETLVQDASNQTDTPDCSEDDAAPYVNTETKMEEPIAEVQTKPEEVPEPIEVPKVEEEEEEEMPAPDLSGLELLSNSIVEFENCRKLEEEAVPAPAPVPVKANDDVLAGMAQMTIADRELVPAEDLGGLDLLCALAEQRIMEEVEENAERKKEKRKSKKHSDEPRHKKPKNSDKLSVDKLSDSSIKSCTCKEDSYKTYKTKESEEEVKKFIASKSQTLCCKGDWPCMNAMELDMRMRLADLQRKYREKQRELSKLKPKKHEKHEKKNRSRKKSINSDRSTPPPLLDKMDVPVVVRANKSQELLKPPTLCRYGSQESVANLVSEPPGQITYDYAEISAKSSKKRKVGRPKKLMSSSGLQTVTETIVAKKPKKGNIVGYLLAAKEKLVQNGAVYSDPPRFIEETTKSKKKKSKIGPKLKAEATIKAYVEDEENEDDRVEVYRERGASVVAEEDVQEEEEESAKSDARCILTTAHLEEDKLRVLTAMGGLFYAGRLNAVEPPDVYSITLDGERGNRPHIMSREEILRDAIVEVSPASTDELAPGTRLCAYWSQQYRCLYPGSVAEPETPDPSLDSKFVSVEFDDGDSGRIAIEDIRLLPPDYPIIEYDPNPLLSLSKRRRRASTTEDRRSVQSAKSPTPPPPPPQPAPAPADNGTEKENQDNNKQEDSHRERKRLKKRKRDKLKQKLLQDPRKKKKKHKCTDEHCKHRKHHKKHRKHKKHHHSKEVQEEKKVVVEEEEEEEEEEPTTAMLGEEETSNTSFREYPEYHIIPNPEDEVTMDDILEAKAQKNNKKIRDRQESCESRSKMSAFLPARQLWGWSGKGYKRPKAKGRSRKQFYRAIQRGKETIQVGDSAVFLSTGRPDRPYIGRIEAMWESCGTMVVKVKWFYHPEETIGCPLNLKYPGALFESPHVDENDVQTISHKCEVLPLKEYTEKLGDDPRRYATIYDNNDIYYLAGYYDPTTMSLKMEPDIPFNNSD